MRRCSSTPPPPLADLEPVPCKRAGGPCHGDGGKAGSKMGGRRSDMKRGSSVKAAGERKQEVKQGSRSVYACLAEGNEEKPVKL